MELSLEILFRIIEIFLIVGLVYYAYVTTQEAQKNRKKDTIEKKLENLYSPLREILKRARQSGSGEYSFPQMELEKILEIIERFGHYFDPGMLEKLRDILKKKIIDIPAYNPEKGPILWFKFKTNELDPYLEHIEERRDQLIDDLRKLTDT